MENLPKDDLRRPDTKRSVSEEDEVDNFLYWRDRPEPEDYFGCQKTSVIVCPNCGCAMDTIDASRHRCRKIARAIHRSYVPDLDWFNGDENMVRLLESK